MTSGAPPCALGLDFGTTSVRAVLVDTRSGAERGSAVAEYRHGVIDRTLPGSEQPLAADWALQHPGDYLESMLDAVAGALHAGRLDPGQVIGIGIDFTSCTILPIDRDGRPLCLLPSLAPRPHAWVKLWKHHAAQPQATRINTTAAARGEPFLASYGGKTSSEWLCAKVLQILDEDPAIYDAAAGFVEAGDWVALQLTGTLVRNACAAGYKGCWTRERGFPSQEFFAALHPGLAGLADKLPGEIVPPGRRIGGLTGEMAARLGLKPGTAVGAAIIDAHSAVPAATVVTPGRMVMVIGTSTCHMLLADRHAIVEGVAGVVTDGIVEGYHGLRGGPARSGRPASAGMHGCSQSGPGGVDGVRRPRARRPPMPDQAATAWSRSTGGTATARWPTPTSRACSSGMTLATTRGRHLPRPDRGDGVSARCASSRRSPRSALPVTELIAVGGLAERSPLLLQIYADVTRRPIGLAASAHTSATGAAMLGAVAAGEAAGGHASFASAAAHDGVPEAGFASNRTRLDRGSTTSSTATISSCTITSGAGARR